MRMAEQGRHRAKAGVQTSHARNRSMVVLSLRRIAACSKVLHGGRRPSTESYIRLEGAEKPRSRSPASSPPRLKLSIFSEHLRISVPHVAHPPIAGRRAIQMFLHSEVEA